MSEWLNQIENHTVHDDIRAALTPAQEIRETAAELDVNTLERVDRIVCVLSELQRRLSATDPLLIPLQPLNNLHNPLTQAAAQLANFQTNKNVAHITNAHNQLENILVHLAQIPSARTSEDMESIREAAVALRRSAGQHIRHLEEEARNAISGYTKLKTNVEALSAEVETKTEEASSLLETINGQFDDSENERKTTFTASLDTQKSASDELLEQKTQEWSAIVQDKQAEYQSIYEATAAKTKSLESEFRTATLKILEQMEERLKEAEKVVGVITDTGMVGGYQRIANSEKRSAIFWRIVAFLSLCVLVLFAVTLFYVTLKSDFKVTPTLTFTRSFVAVAVAILAGYAARQADKHERAQRSHRKMELELASISPYLHEFPDEEARKIKTELANKMFGQQDISIESGGGKKTTNATLNLLEMALDSLRALIGKQS